MSFKFFLIECLVETHPNIETPRKSGNKKTKNNQIIFSSATVDGALGDQNLTIAKNNLTKMS